LSLARTRRPRVCFMAPMDSDSYLMRFYKAFAGRDCLPAHLSLFSRDGRDLEKFLVEQDVIYVGGGNTANMLAIWRVHGVDAILRKAWEGGTVLCGVSAGMNCWFEASCSDSFGPLAALKDGVGLLPGSACPHYDGEVNRIPIYRVLVGNGELPSGYAADDGAALYFKGTDLVEAIASRPGKKAYRVEKKDGRSIETELATRVLSSNQQVE